MCRAWGFEDHRPGWLVCESQHIDCVFPCSTGWMSNLGRAGGNRTHDPRNMSLYPDMPTHINGNRFDLSCPTSARSPCPTTPPRVAECRPAPPTTNGGGRDHERRAPRTSPATGPCGFCSQPCYLHGWRIQHAQCAGTCRARSCPARRERARQGSSAATRPDWLGFRRRRSSPRSGSGCRCRCPG